LRPVLEDAMHELGEQDRHAVLLRFFQNKSLKEVGLALDLGENAARMRVDRALEKLRIVLMRRGIVSGASLASVISAHAVQVAPAGLAATLTTASIATTGTTTFTLLKIMTATKLKLVFAALVVAGGAAAVVMQQQTQQKLRAENELFRQQILQLQTDNESYSNQLAQAPAAGKLSEAQLNELLKLRGEVGALRNQSAQLGQLREENQRLRNQKPAAPGQSPQLSPEDQFQLQEWHTVSTMKYAGLAMRIYSNDHNNELVTNFDQITADKTYDTNSPGSIPLENFEFMNSGHLSYAQPEMIQFREKNPRRTLQGQWVREYGLVDGSVQTIHSDDGSFDEFEKQHSPPPPNQ
jgi:hypothetical protein